MSEIKLESFLGIPFGSSAEKAKQIFQQRPGCVFESTNSDAETLIFTGVKFAGRDTLFVILFFFEDKFCKSAVHIEPKLEAYAIDLYKEIKNEINGKYFVTLKDYENYTEPYEKNDGHTETAIAIGKADFSCFWNFKNETLIDDYISVSINEELNIVINYENGYLTDLLVEKRKANDISDY